MKKRSFTKWEEFYYELKLFLQIRRNQGWVSGSFWTISLRKKPITYWDPTWKRLGTKEQCPSRTSPHEQGPKRVLPMNERHPGELESWEDVCWGSSSWSSLSLTSSLSKPTSRLCSEICTVSAEDRIQTSSIRENYSYRCEKKYSSWVWSWKLYIIPWMDGYGLRHSYITLKWILLDFDSYTSRTL